VVNSYRIRELYLCLARNQTAFFIGATTPAWPQITIDFPLIPDFAERLLRETSRINISLLEVCLTPKECRELVSFMQSVMANSGNLAGVAAALKIQELLDENPV
jgi:hypothetical protein